LYKKDFLTHRLQWFILPNSNLYRLYSDETKNRFREAQYHVFLLALSDSLFSFRRRHSITFFGTSLLKSPPSAKACFTIDELKKEESSLGITKTVSTIIIVNPAERFFNLKKC
jgi:hypothetical protein